MAEISDYIREFNPWWIGKFSLDYQEREIYSKIKKFLDMPQIIALTGLRRVGKTTIMHKIAEDYLSLGFNPRNIFFFSFDDLQKRTLKDILDEYERIAGLTLSTGKFLFLFDEIQKVENWQEQIKILYDLYKGRIKIIVSGSESLFIKRKSKESLAGRIFEFKLDTLTFEEFVKFKGVKYDSLEVYKKEYSKLFEEFIFSGGFPELVGITDKEKITKYIKEGIRDKVLYKDIPSIFKIEDISVLNSILESITENPGQLIELSTFSGECKISRPTLANYLRYLEDSFLITKLYNFSKNKRKTERKLRKYYPSLVSLNLIFSEEPLLKSKAFENVLVNQLKSEFFWRDAYKNEVDIILHNKEIIPVEVKYGNIKETDGLIRFMSLFNVNRGVIISREEEGVRKYSNKEIKITPAWKFLMTNHFE